jgi:hypothetical protein
LTITHLQLYFLVGHGVRWFGDLTCDFAEVFGERFFWGSRRYMVRSGLRTPRVETYRDDGTAAWGIVIGVSPYYPVLPVSPVSPYLISESRPIRQAQGKLWGTRLWGGVGGRPPAAGH